MILAKGLHQEGLVHGHIGGAGAAVLDLHFLRHIGRQTQAVGDIGGQMVAADRQHLGVPDVAVNKNRQVGGAAADIHHHNAHFLLGISQRHLSRSQRVEDVGLHLDAGRFHALGQVLHRGGGGGDDVGLHLQPEAVHAQRLADALLPVHDEAARDDVQHFAPVRDGDGLGRIQRPVDIVLLDAVAAAADAHHPAAVDRGHMRAGQADKGRADLKAGGALRLVHGAGDGAAGLLHIHHYALAHPLRRLQADAQNPQLAVLIQVRDQGADLGGADVNAYEER